MGRYGAGRDVRVNFLLNIYRETMSSGRPISPLASIPKLGTYKISCLGPPAERGKDARFKTGLTKHQNGVLPTTQCGPQAQSSPSSSRATPQARFPQPRSAITSDLRSPHIQTITKFHLLTTT